MIYQNAVGNVSIKVNTNRFDKNFIKAQKKLDMMVLGHSTPYVPFLSGHLRSSGHIVEDGLIEWKTPYAHYMYVGKLYLTENGSSWARRYEKKYKTDTDLKYHHDRGGSQWVEKARAVHGEQWVSTVKRIAGGGV